MQIKDAMGNDHGRPRDIVGEVRQAFTSTADTAFDVCLENQLVGRSKFRSARELLYTLSYILWRHTHN
jgi:p24 family protein delta-1